jgi:hypothetical protein
LTDLSLANILFDSAKFSGGCSAGLYQKLVINKQKFFFISIHKPPVSLKFAPMKHSLAVTVESFKFSPAKPVAYEWS